MGGQPRESSSASGFRRLPPLPVSSKSSTGLIPTNPQTHGVKSLTSSTVEHLGVRAAPEKVIPIRQETVTTTEAPSRSTPSAPDRRDSVALQAFLAIASVLAARVLLLLGGIGAFVLAWVAAHSNEWTPLFVLIAYGLLVVGPLAWLDWHRGPGSGG